MSPRRANPRPERYVARNGEVTHRVRYRLGKSQTSETFTTRSAALDFCADIRDFGGVEAERRLAERTAEYTSATPTLDEVFEEFCTWTARRVRSTRTVEDYQRDYRRAITSTFGATRVNDITPDAVQSWVDAMVDGRVAARRVKGGSTPLAAKTICDRHSLLSTVLGFAAKPPRRHLTGNPCDHTDLPRKHRKPPRGVRTGEWQALWAALLQIDPDAADLAFVLYSTGARFSEVTALTTHAVEDHGGDEVVLIIDHVIRREAGSVLVRVSDTKSEAGFRRVRVDPGCSEVIRRRFRQAKPGALLFTTRRGSMWRPSNFRDRAWLPACDLANLSPRPSPHGLRHAHVAEMARDGATVGQIRKRLGHESITTTMNVYGGLIEEVQSDVLRKFAARRDGPALPAGPVIVGEVTG